MISGVPYWLENNLTVFNSFALVGRDHFVKFFPGNTADPDSKTVTEGEMHANIFEFIKLKVSFLVRNVN